MTQYDIQNAINTIDGYYIPRAGEPSSGAFQRAKVEAEKALQARLAHIEGISFGRWEAARDHAQPASPEPDWAVLGPRLAEAVSELMGTFENGYAPRSIESNVKYAPGVKFTLRPTVEQIRAVQDLLPSA